MITLFLLLACKGQQKKTELVTVYYIDENLKLIESVEEQSIETPEQMEKHMLIDPCTPPSLNQRDSDLLKELKEELYSIDCDLKNALRISFLSSDSLSVDDITFYSKSCEAINKLAVERILKISWPHMECEGNVRPMRWSFQWRPKGHK